VPTSWCLQKLSERFRVVGAFACTSTATAKDGSGNLQHVCPTSDHLHHDHILRRAVENSWSNISRTLPKVTRFISRSQPDHGDQDANPPVD
jgi:hypothetical protein